MYCYFRAFDAEAYPSGGGKDAERKGKEIKQVQNGKSCIEPIEKEEEIIKQREAWPGPWALVRIFSATLESRYQFWQITRKKNPPLHSQWEKLKPKKEKEKKEREEKKERNLGGCCVVMGGKKTVRYDTSSIP